MIPYETLNCKYCCLISLQRICRLWRFATDFLQQYIFPTVLLHCSVSSFSLRHSKRRDATLFFTRGENCALWKQRGVYSKTKTMWICHDCLQLFFISLQKPLMWGANETDRDVYAGKRRTATVLFFFFDWDCRMLINSPIIAERSCRQPCEEQQFGPIILGFVICRFGLIWRAPVHYFLNGKFQVMVHPD